MKEALTLADLVWDWISSNRELHPHLFISKFIDGFYIETRCADKHTLAWIPSNFEGQFIWISRDCAHLNIHPAQPNFFPVLEEQLRRLHNAAYNDGYTYNCPVKL